MKVAVIFDHHRQCVIGVTKPEVANSSLMLTCSKLVLVDSEDVDPATGTQTFRFADPRDNAGDKLRVYTIAMHEVQDRVDHL
jgi:hypothetical protein